MNKWFPKAEAFGGSGQSPALTFLHLQGGGCGGCAVELDAIAFAGLHPVASPRHADLLLVSGSVGKTLMPAVEACWAAMPEPRWLVAIGACAADGGPFSGYAVAGGIGERLPVSLAIPGCPPTPQAMRAGLAALRDAILSAAAPARPARPPAALPRPRAGGDSS